MLDMRVARLETDVAEIKTDLREMRGDLKGMDARLGRMEERFARMEGGFQALGAKIDARPTTFTVAAFVISTSLATTTVIVAVLALIVRP